MERYWCLRWLLQEGVSYRRRRGDPRRCGQGRRSTVVGASTRCHRERGTLRLSCRSPRSICWMRRFMPNTRGRISPDSGEHRSGSAAVTEVTNWPAKPPAFSCNLARHRRQLYAPCPFARPSSSAGILASRRTVAFLRGARLSVVFHSFLLLITLRLPGSECAEGACPRRSKWC